MNKRAYKYRLYPTPEQMRNFACTFGCCRFVYNWALRLRTTAYFERGQRLYYSDLSEALTALKKEEGTAWLRDVSSVPLQQALIHLDKSLINFFEGRTKYPVYKKKRGTQSASYVATAFRWDGTHLILAKQDEPLAIAWSRPLPKDAKPSSVTVSKDPAGRYFISILVEETITPLPPLDDSKSIGIDLGLKSFVIMSDGETIANPKYYARDEKKLAKAQRRHAKKQKGSKNREKARRQVARLHARIADQRRDFQHKLSTRLIRENQVICLETLAVKNMLHNHKLAKAISDVGWSEFTRQLEYKAEWYGRTVVKIDRWYPSSKRCHVCGYVMKDMPLEVREWACPQCRTVHDRDINAAKNVLAAGLVASACGDHVRPVVAKAATGNGRRSRKSSSSSEG